RGLTSLSSDLTPSASGNFIMSVTANSEPECKEFDIPKPPRFGRKREAYINKYRTANKCVNSKRFASVDSQSEQLVRVISELSRANANSPLAFPIPASVKVL